MPEYLINGTYRIVGASPDGDSVRFYPDDPEAFKKTGLPVRTNARGAAQLRLDGIDALELHYTPQNGSRVWHQEPVLAAAAASSLLTSLGFTEVERDDGGVVTRSVPDAAPGHILTGAADSHGRAVALAFAARRRGPAPDLSQVVPDVRALQNSANWAMLRQGVAFPTFYTMLDASLREEFVAATAHARSQQRGVWPRDLTESGFEVRSGEQLSRQVVLPKLFRRLADYLTLSGPDEVNLAGFRDYLAARADRLITIPDGNVTYLDSLVEVVGPRVRLTVPPERIVFFER